MAQEKVFDVKDGLITMNMRNFRVKLSDVVDALNQSGEPLVITKSRIPVGFYLPIHRNITECDIDKVMTYMEYLLNKRENIFNK